MILIDFSGIAHAMTVVSWDNTVDAIKTEHGGTIDEDDIPKCDDFNDRFGLEMRSRILTELLKVKRKYSKDGEEIVIAIDAKLNWRKKIFKEYKANRKKNRDKDKIDWPLAYEIRNEFVEALEKYFFFKILKYEDEELKTGCEADDIIGILVRHIAGSDRIIIISDDIDFYQLHDEDNVTQYNYKGVKKTDKHASKNLKYDHYFTPKEFKEIKILNGDRKDGIPNFMSDDDVFIDDNKRSATVGAKTSYNIYLEENKMVAKYGLMKDIRKNPNYMRNKSVYDLDEIPQEIKDIIIGKYLNYQYTGSVNLIIAYLKKYVNVSSKHLINSAHDFQVRGVSPIRRRRRRKIPIDKTTKV